MFVLHCLCDSHYVAQLQRAKGHTYYFKSLTCTSSLTDDSTSTLQTTRLTPILRDSLAPGCCSPFLGQIRSEIPSHDIPFLILKIIKTLYPALFLTSATQSLHLPQHMKLSLVPLNNRLPPLISGLIFLAQRVAGRLVDRWHL